MLILDWRGSLIQVLTPKHPGNAKLIWQQYQATLNDVGLGVSIELVRQKIRAQLNTLATLPILYEKRFSAADTLENGLVRLRSISTTDALLKLEGKLASAYFNVLLDMPIKWPKSVAKTLPPHWLSITERTSPLSKNHGGRWAINPFHSALNFAYALLEAQVLQSVTISALEPTCGYLHAYEEGTNTLVFDLMEPFRAIVDAKWCIR